MKAVGKLFRKYLGNLLTGQRSTVKKMTDKANYEAEDAASTLFDSIDVDYYVWPKAQTKPDGETNRTVFNVNNIRILKIEQVEVNAKNELIPGSGKEVTV